MTVAIGVVCSRAMEQRCLSPAARASLAALGDVRLLHAEQPHSWDHPPPFDPAVEGRLIEFARGLDALVIGPGAPRLGASFFDAVPNVRFVGELEGDRFARRIDLAAAHARGIKVVDTTQGSSYPVAEWALALMLIGLRNAGELFRRLAGGEIIDGEWKKAQFGYRVAELTGRTVGLIGCGHVGRTLVRLLEPFKVRINVHDPGLPAVVADLLDLHVMPLGQVMAQSDVVVCSVPLTSATFKMIGARELALLRPDGVFVNVGRGKVVDTEALIERLRKGDVIACLDVVEPENPIPVDSPLRTLPNVFLSPHIAGVTAQCGPRFVTLMAEEIRRHLAGEGTRYDLVARE